jgi:predicted nucleic acid-binding protein
VKFWDASAIVPLLVAEAATAQLQRLLAEDGAMLVWWASAVECASALSRLERDQALDAGGAAAAFARLERLTAAWHEIAPSDVVKENATRFLRVHPLRAADALQIAAAFVASDRRPPSLHVVTLDDRLANAMAKEGFPIVGGA